MPLYPFDPLGTLNTNKISNEIHTLSVVNGVDHNYIVPEAAPFYEESLVIVDVNSGIILAESIDYFFAYNFVEASEKIGKAISGVIGFVDVNRTGSFALHYQTIGDVYVDDITPAISNGIDALENITSRNWEDIATLPAAFPPTPHTLRLEGITGMTEVLAKLAELEAAIRAPSRHIMLSDIVDVNEGLLTPIQDNFASIANAITLLNTVTVPLTITRQVIIPTINGLGPNTWISTFIDITIAELGEYTVMFAGHMTAVDTGGNPADIAYRFTVNGAVVSGSYQSGAVIGLDVGDVVTLEIKHNSPLAANVIMSSPDTGGGITLIRLNN